MGHYDKLCKIDIDKMSADVLKSIADSRRIAEIVRVVGEFFDSLKGKAQIDRRIADKLKSILDSMPVGVTDVYYLGKGVSWTHDAETWEVEVKARGLEGYYLKFMFIRPVGTLDVNYNFNGLDGMDKHADDLEAKIPEMEEAAKSFNIHLQWLKELSSFSGGLHPLTTYFHWYQLHD